MTAETHGQMRWMGETWCRGRRYSSAWLAAKNTLRWRASMHATSSRRTTIPQLCPHTLACPPRVLSAPPSRGNRSHVPAPARSLAHQQSSLPLPLLAYTTPCHRSHPRTPACAAPDRPRPRPRPASQPASQTAAARVSPTHPSIPARPTNPRP